MEKKQQDDLREKLINETPESVYFSTCEQSRSVGESMKELLCTPEDEAIDFSVLNKKSETWKLKSKKADCMICLESLFWPNKQIWTCNACNKSVHLSCMLKWAKKLSENLGSQSTSAESREEFALELHLVNCPHCNFIYETCNLVYKCFCGKVENPGEVYGSQHSCGKKCNRFLSTKCEHLCREICHFGKCLPCEILVTASCFCKKTKKEVDCFQQNKGETDKGCGQICGKALNLSLIHI